VNAPLERLKETLGAVLPITAIVMILHMTLVPMEPSLLYGFLLGASAIIVGLVLFLIGVDLGITPLGSMTGEVLAKKNRLWIVLAAGLILGFLITVAEPGLLVLANQVERLTVGNISSFDIVMVVSGGLAVMVALGLVRIIFNWPLYIILTILYGAILLFARFVSPEFLAIAFDASGATTGLLAVPFILALSIGISHLKADSRASEKDSFGLIAIASTGAIFSVLLLGIVSEPKDMQAGLEPHLPEKESVLEAFSAMAPESFWEAVVALMPLLVVFFVLNMMAFRLRGRRFTRVLKGFAYAFLGLSLFLLGVNAGFMDVGSELGYRLASMDSGIYVVAVAFILGIVTILAEPAVYVLTHQIEEVTSGSVQRKFVLTALALGVGVAVALSIVRVLVPPVQLWHYLLPGYVVCVILTYVVPKLFVGIAFDAGGVATGPMTATFIMAFTNGAAEAFDGADVLIDGLGMIAMVAMMPIITLQILGFLFRARSVKEGVDSRAH